MNTGAFGENFPYSNFHDLNMDWIIKIAKDFLDQYTNIQEIIRTGSDNLHNEIEQGLQELDSSAEELTASLNEWYTTHENYLDQTLIDNINAFTTEANERAEQAIESIPSDYTELYNTVTDILNAIGGVTVYPMFNIARQYGFVDGKVIDIATGNLTDNADFIASGLIRVTPLHRYSGTFTNHVAFYDINQTFTGNYFNQQTVFTVPKDVYFIRIDANKNWRREKDIILAEGNYSVPELFSIAFYDMNSFRRTDNLFNPAAFSDNTNVNWDSGLVDNTDFGSSTFIPVQPNTQYTGNFTNHLTWFTITLAPISSTNGQTTVTSPSTARFARFDFKKSIINANSIMFVAGSQLPEEFVPYLLPVNFSFMQREFNRYNNWYQKTWSAYGDSITAISNGDGLSLGWAKYVNDKIPFKMFYGRGIGGQKYTWTTGGGSVCFIRPDGNYESRNDQYTKDNFPLPAPSGTVAVRGCMCSWDRITHMFPASIKNNINVVFMMAGTNDSIDTTELEWVYGSTTDPEWAESEYYNSWNGDYNITTLAGGMASAILKLQAWMPQALIVIGTPLNGRTEVPGGVTPQHIPTEYQKSMTIMETARKFGCEVIDVFGTCGINVLNSPTFITDGAHPYNVAGEKMLARTITPKLDNIQPRE